MMPVITDYIFGSELYDILLEQSKLWQWTYGKHSNVNTRNVRNWHLPFAGARQSDFKEEQKPCEEELKKTNRLLYNIWKVIQGRITPQSNTTLYRCYANAHCALNPGEIHIDSQSDRALTLVIFVCDDWKAEWGGELIVYERDKSEIMKAIMPKRGRAVLFPGLYPHIAHAPPQWCQELRVTLMYKFELDEVCL